MGRASAVGVCRPCPVPSGIPQHPPRWAGESAQALGFGVGLLGTDLPPGAAHRHPPCDFRLRQLLTFIRIFHKNTGISSLEKPEAAASDLGHHRGFPGAPRGPRGPVSICAPTNPAAAGQIWPHSQARPAAPTPQSNSKGALGETQALRPPDRSAPHLCPAGPS